MGNEKNYRSCPGFRLVHEPLSDWLLEISVYVLGSNRLVSVSTCLELSPEFRSEVELLPFFGKHSRRLLDNREGESP